MKKIDKNILNIKFVIKEEEEEIDLSSVVKVRYTKDNDDFRFMISYTRNPKTLTSKQVWKARLYPAHNYPSWK